MSVSPFHRHRWEIHERLEQPSPVEMARQVDASLTVESYRTDEVISVHTRPVVVTKRCADCGAERVERV